LSSTALAFRAATILVTEPGDTWESIGEKALGDPALWPIVVLLNLELTADGEFVPPGTYLRVPKTLPLGESI
jgi:nucleoid-associated protein YgaU